MQEFKINNILFKKSSLLMLAAAGLILSSVPSQAEESGEDPTTHVEWRTDNSVDGVEGAENTTNGNRHPVSVVQTSRTNTPYNGVTFAGKKWWGHKTDYGLKVVDNNGNEYGLGQPRESFANTQSFAPAGANWNPGAASTWPQGSKFVDHNMAIINKDTGAGTKWYSFDQNWSIVEVGTTWSNIDMHGIVHYQDSTTRSGAN